MAMTIGRDVRADDGQARLLVTLERLLAIRATEVTDALGEAGRLVAEAVGGEKAEVFLYDPADESLAAVGVTQTDLARQEQALGLDHLPLANGGRIVDTFQTGEAYLTGQADRDPAMLAAVTQDLAVRSALLAPLHTDGERRGVVLVVSTQPAAFTSDDLRFLEAVAGWVGLVVQRAESMERTARDAAERARRDTAEELIDVLAHDLRTPLTPLRGHLDLIRRIARHEGRQDYLRHVADADAALQRLTRMIAEVLDTSRLDRGLFTLDVEPVDLAALARETADLLRVSEVEIRVQAPDALPIEGDPQRLRQALENLLSNALQHSPPGVPVHVTVETERREDEGRAVVSVRDAGPGIPPALLPTLFERFARGAHSTGLGLGLYLAQGIAAAHGGALTVASHLGEGTTFCLSVPLTPGHRDA